jgi:hypothetical protein
MIDGPTNAFYILTHTGSRYYPECEVYKIQPFTVGDDISYFMREGYNGIETRLLRSFDKMLASVNVYQNGEREHFPYMQYCCYCQPIPGGP